MAIKFQYNKTSLQQIEKQLKMRVRTLPIIKNKETALRLEVKKCKEESVDLEKRLEDQIAGYESMYALWGEFDPSLVALKDVDIDVKKIAGVRVPVLTNIRLEVKPFGLFSSPKWYFDGIVRGGILAEVCWNWLEIHTFMIDEDIRKTGFGTKLLAEIETIALEKECDFIKVDTLSFQALGFYEKNGYQVYGSIDNVGRDFEHYYLKKDLKK